MVAPPMLTAKVSTGAEFSKESKQEDAPSTGYNVNGGVGVCLLNTNDYDWERYVPFCFSGVEISGYGCASSKGWCVQQEIKPARAKVRSPVTWITGRRETDALKLIDKIIYRMVVSRQAVMKMNAEVAPKVSSLGGRVRNRRMKTECAFEN